MSRLELRNVTKSFGGVVAADAVSLAFDAGKVSALIGPNGAGKTTVFNLIGGILCPDSGKILYGGRTISGLPPWEVARAGIGRLFQDVCVFDRLSVMDNMLAAFKGQKGESALYSLVMRRRVKREDEILSRKALELLGLVGLAELAGQIAGQLSYGQRKLLALSRLLAADMSVLLLDEPTAGVNMLTIEAILRVIRRLADEGKTVVVIEHDMGIVSELVDIVFFMEDGRVSSSGTPEAVLGSQIVKDAFLGI